MTRFIHKTLAVLAAILLALPMVAAETPDYKLHKYAPGNGGILRRIAPDGKWAVINLGTTASGMHCNSELFNCETGEHFEVKFSGQTLSFEAVSNVGADGCVTIVGSFANRPMAYRFDPLKPTVMGKFKSFTNLPNWSLGVLSSVTPDGKYAVGHYTNYTGADVIGADLNGEFWFRPLFVNTETGEAIETPNLPTGDRYGIDQHAMNFSEISADGKYILGSREWYMPVEGFHFIYDVEKQDYTPIGFVKENGKLVAVDNIGYVDDALFSTNGRYVGGMLIRYGESSDDNIPSERKMPFRYDITTGEMTIFDGTESSNISVGCIDDNGTILGNPENGTPLRDFKIFYQDKFWIPFAQLCQQVYGFNFMAKTDFEFTGTAWGISADGRRFISFSDPQGESYMFDFGMSVEEACSKFDLLSNYTVSPKRDAYTSQITTVEINFGRAVQVLGKGNTHLHLYKVGKDGAEDQLIANGLSTSGESGGLHLKPATTSTVVGVFRSRDTHLTPGEDYYVLLDGGAVAPEGDANMVNKPIRIDYHGRAEGPVQIVKVTPEDGSSLKFLDSNSSYIQLTFDCPVALTDTYDAFLTRIDNDGLSVFVSPLAIAVGNTDETKSQIRIYPSSPIYLLENVEYRVVLAGGSICDYAATEESYNKGWSMTLKGTYVREVGTENSLFFDDFNDPNASLNKWLNWDCDKNVPLVKVEEMGFDQNNTPWNFSTHDASDDPDYYASSHSLYAPSGTSDDWMMTPQIHIPADGKARLEFDAQKLNPNKDDHLWLYIYQDDYYISYLDDYWMKDIKASAVLLDEIKDLPAGEGERAKGNWKHYAYDLAAYADKDIYIAFVNKNTNQSMVLVDNVSVQREILYTLGFSNEQRVVNQEKIDIKGTFTIKTPDFQSGAVRIVLKDAEGKEVSRREWPNIVGTSIKDTPIPLSFPDPLPLVAGKDNHYSIDVTFDGKDKNGNPYQKGDTYEGVISNLIFSPIKHVVLEEMTGITCPNCPQGHIVIDLCKQQFKDQFIPISIHSYDGDNLGAAFIGYSSFLGLNGAPSARINRIKGTKADAGIYYPMYGLENKVLYDMPEQNLWFNVIGKELQSPALCDVYAFADYSPADDRVNVTADVKYALEAEQLLSVFTVVLEDGIVSYQENNFANSDAEGLGEWGLNGQYGTYYAYPVVHNEVVRGVVGDTFNGTLGMFPQKFEPGLTYSRNYSFSKPAAITDMEKVSVVVMLIDTQTQEVVNATKTKLTVPGGGGSGSGIESVVMDQNSDAPIYNAAGVMMNNADGKKLPAGLYIKNGKKVVIR